MSASFLARLRDSYKLRQLSAATNRLFWTAVSPLRRLFLKQEIGRRPGAVHIHFGCGTIVDARFINVEARALAHVHLVTKSPLMKAFPADSADSIYACHVFEHLPFRTQQQVLTRWLAILKPGGRLMLSVPDFDLLVDKFVRCDRNPASIQATLMGAQDYAGNFHHAIFTRTHLERLLAGCGFDNISRWHPADEVSWPPDFSWADDVSLNVCAHKPLQPHDRALAT